MSRDKQIEEMGTIIATKAFERAHEIDGDENLADIVATELYNAGYRKTSDIARVIFEEIDNFQRKLRYIFLGMCGGNDYSKLNLLQIDNAIEALFDSHIAELKKKYTKSSKEITEGEE